jgi:hypothetical protein
VQLGADEAVDYRSQDFEDMYKNDPFDAVVDLIGGRAPFAAGNPLPQMQCPHSPFFGVVQLLALISFLKQVTPLNIAGRRHRSALFLTLVCQFRYISYCCDDLCTKAPSYNANVAIQARRS